MDKTHIDNLNVFASGVYEVELSAGKRINANHRVPVKASVDITTGEVRFYIEPESITVLSRDSNTD
ncbi:hypothetical protein KPL76_12885 [Subtercola sp. PAMC28395]|uniref:hypothetical protein n=1 Tax=Subtercola sp. PAMC28395 TaxID=2846775 RepID=UPI001C0B3F6C|nr:hypothetical protein [Subtercola sp. PAMC28395]QWT23586.1 hypothetical protein KPL76_12885 [Subtercola sp. PAMC28395]